MENAVDNMDLPRDDVENAWRISLVADRITDWEGLKAHAVEAFDELCEAHDAEPTEISFGEFEDDTTGDDMYDILFVTQTELDEDTYYEMADECRDIHVELGTGFA